MTYTSKPLSEFLNYLVTMDDRDHQRLPSLTELSRILGISVTTLREQLEAARVLGVVEVKPKTGIRRLDYSFLPSVRQSLTYAIEMNRSYFQYFSDLRTHLESAYWYEATSKLTPDDLNRLRNLVRDAQKKLTLTPPQIPQNEHRQLHLGIYSRLDNPFVLGLLEAYWEAYEEVGLDVYTDFQYLTKVWDYHSRMVEAISAGDFEHGFRLFSEHIQLLNQRNSTSTKHNFE
jgi:DNA-binding FadR family transcriptional regulator